MKIFPKILIYAVAPLTIAALSFYSAYSYLESKRTFTPAQTSPDSVIERDLNRIKLQNALVEGFEKKKELITLETELSEVALWDESWGELGIFHKSQSVKFYGTGIYICDLNEIQPDGININFNLKRISIEIPAPVIKSVTIDEARTEYETVSKGWLRFGDVRLTQQQHALIYGSVKESMEKSMKSRQLVKKAEESSITAVYEIFTDILDALGENYTVNVYIKQEAS